ncbi:TRAP transporter permease [Murdochiella vaginalis]|uniref:TRAP transporter permease n=1 Tax=Murdochiella vaginalis TaxID=1852373 RepID=UPI0008FDA2CD|nr:TRAP transporter permease [Murdochiella vaginalis]
MTDEIKKTSDPAPEVEDTGTGTMADVEEIMKKYDRESNTRIWTGTPAMIIKFTMAAFALFMIWLNLFANWDERIRRCMFLGTIIVFAFVMYPLRKGDTSRVNHMPFYDIILMLLGAGSFFYFIVNFKGIIDQATRIHQTEIILGIIGIIILAEACRRVVGLPILFVAGFFVIYSFAQGKALRVIIYNLFYTTTGVIGTPIGVCSTYIVLFIIFGAFLEGTGISDFFIQVANSVAGASKGGPAKVAVISSALCGMVSGSSVANTVTTGSVTIPLMKKTGYRSEFAGAVEASASTGGQIMPPIMGAAAFLMSEMVGVPYAEIAVKAILPALLYFLGIFIAVHLEALRTGLMGLKKEDLPHFGKLVLKQGYLLLPLIILVWMVMNGFTMARSAVIATLVAIVVSMFRKETRMTPMGFVNVLENGTKNTISVAIACGVAGIIAGVVTMTGLGQVLISAIVGLANGKLIIALMLTMVTCIVLGMGVPTTANYIIMATTCAPILVSGMGVNAIAANMFVFYFGIIADITPPVALAAYAGSAIARSNPMKTALTATRLAIAAFIVPYIFVMSPALLFIDTQLVDIILIVITSIIGLFGVSAGLAGFVYTKMPIWQRVLSVIGGLLLIYPGIVTDIAGVALVGTVLALQYLNGKKQKEQATA